MTKVDSWLIAIALSVAAFVGVAFVSVGVIYLWNDQSSIDAEQATINADLARVAREVARATTSQLERDCQQDVRNIDNQRAMWLAIFDLYPESDTVADLRVLLEERIPPHKCVNGVAVPQEVQP